MNPEIEGMFHELKHEIQMLRSELAQLTGAVNLKVDKTDIVNQINISQEDIRINADKLKLRTHTRDVHSPPRI